jgi:hypothetical protein
MNKTNTENSMFAVCISTEGYPASLEVGKLYQIVKDGQAEFHGYFRIIDESGEDYGYAKDRFFPLSIPKALEAVLFRAA